MWSSIDQMFSGLNLQLCLLAGSGILAVSLLVLAVTRWGHSRPVWKCVILSFVAHVLFMGYAYGTYLVFEPTPLAVQPDPLRINLVDEVGKSAIDVDSTNVALPPWDEFVNPQIQPDSVSLDRPEIDSSIVLERATSQNITAPKLDAAAELPQQSEVDFQAPALEIVSPSDLVSSESTDENIPSPEMEIPRRDQEMPTVDEAPQFSAPLETKRAEINNDFQPLPPSVPIDVETKPAFVSDLLDRNAEFANTQLLLPPPTAAAQTDDFRPLRPLTAFNQMKLVSSPRRLADGQPLPQIYSLRNSQDRLAIAQQRGGSIETEKAVNDALQWLAENQEADGRWDASRWGAGKETQVFGHDRKGAGADADTGITGLATLAFLAAGHTHLEGPYQDQLRRALEFLVKQQSVDGSLAGDARLFAKMYCHSMTLLALSEALALTGDQRLSRPVQLGVDYSVLAQNRQDGGWRYQPGDSGDMSQFGWQVLALHSARLGGAVVPATTMDRMQNFLEKCSSGVGGGLASYRPGQGPSTTMTAEALLCRFVLDKTVPATTLMEASRKIATELPSAQHINLYYWYYGTLAMYHAGGPDWEQWNREMKIALLSTQVKTGADEGSWAPDCLWGSYGGRVYSTAMATLNLEVYYRYLPAAEIASDDTKTPKLR